MDESKNSAKLPERISTTPGGRTAANPNAGGKDAAKDIIPDEVPRKDGPGGEGK